MKKILMSVMAVLSLCLAAADSEAAQRLGGGRNLGQQREMIKQPAPKSPAQQAAPAATPAQQPQSGMSKWLGPLAGLALGAGLASLFMNNGMAGAFGGILMMLLIAAVIMFAWRMFRSKSAPASPPLQFAGNSAPSTQSDPSTRFGAGFGAAMPAVAANRYPPGFDLEQFLHHAKLNFTRLQACNDQRDMSTLRDFMTPDLYAEVVADINARDQAPQKTEVPTLNAEMIEVVTEGDAYIASVRFSGMLRHSADTPAEPFSEVWHLEKPLNGRTGWLICGIQQD